MVQIEALKLLGVKRMVGLTYFRDDLNLKFANFFEQAGFKVAAMKGVNVPFSDVGKMPNPINKSGLRPQLSALRPTRRAIGSMMICAAMMQDDIIAVAERRAPLRQPE